VDDAGRVIGVTTTVADTAQGIGFAIPIDIAKPIMQQALAGTKLSRPFIGISYVALDPGVAAKYNLPLDHGAWVHKEDSSGNSVDAVVADGRPTRRASRPATSSPRSRGKRLTRRTRSRTCSCSTPRPNHQPRAVPRRPVLTVRVTLGTRPEPQLELEPCAARGGNHGRVSARDDG